LDDDIITFGEICWNFGVFGIPQDFSENVPASGGGKSRTMTSSGLGKFVGIFWEFFGSS
jgi:hypothetical protein